MVKSRLIDYYSMSGLECWVVWSNRICRNHIEYLKVTINMKIIYRRYIKKLQLLFVGSDISHMHYL